MFSRLLTVFPFFKKCGCPKLETIIHAELSKIGIIYYLTYGNPSSIFQFGISFFPPQQSTSVDNIQFAVLLSGFFP